MNFPKVIILKFRSRDRSLDRSIARSLGRSIARSLDYDHSTCVMPYKAHAQRNSGSRRRAPQGKQGVMCHDCKSTYFQRSVIVQKLMTRVYISVLALRFAIALALSGL